MSRPGKTIAIVAYLHLIGWIIAMVMHQKEPTSLGRFHLRQMFGLMASQILVGFVVVRLSAFVAGICGVILLVFWVIGLISAINEEERPLPFIGEYFQQWFSFLD